MVTVELCFLVTGSLGNLPPSMPLVKVVVTRTELVIYRQRYIGGQPKGWVRVRSVSITGQLPPERLESIVKDLLTIGPDTPPEVAAEIEKIPSDFRRQLMYGSLDVSAIPEVHLPEGGPVAMQEVVPHG